MKKVIYVVLVLSVLFISGIANDTINYIAERLEIYNAVFPEEKIYVHTDKEIYSVGERVWYKTYLTMGALEKPSELSEAAYVQLLAPDNSIIETQIVKAEEGTAHGDFRIDGKQGEGIYKIRAYTNWIKNNDQYFFNREIPVYDFRDEEEIRAHSATWVEGESSYDLILEVNLDKMFTGIPQDRKLETVLDINSQQFSGEVFELEGNKRKITFSIPSKLYESTGDITLEIFDESWVKQFRVIKIKVPGEKIDLKFFPEGGFLIENVTSKLAFKAVGPDGYSRKVSGKIVDERGDSVAGFATTHHGMGFIPFRPEAGKEYQAVLDRYGNSLKFDLPRVENLPFVLKLNQTKKHILVTLQQHPNAVDFGELTIIGQSGSEIYYAANIDKSDLEKSILIPLSKFPTGIVHFTVFSNRKPITERLVFVEHPNAEISMAADKEIYKKRSRVGVSIEVQDSLGRGVEGRFSMTAVDNTRTKVDNNRENIASWLLVGSDLKGHIEDPGNYFDESNPDRYQKLDLLMMTQGWSRFKWDSLLKEEITIKSPEHYVEKGLTIPGRLTKLSNENKGSGGGEVTLITLGETQDVYSSEVNEDGQFLLSGIELFDKTEAKIFGNNKRGRPHVSFELDTTHYISSPEITEFRSIVEVDEVVWGYLHHSKKVYQVSMAYPDQMQDIVLDEVTVQGNRITRIEKEIKEYGKIYSQVDHRLDVSKLPGVESAISVIDLLRGRIPGLQIDGGSFDPVLTIRGNGGGSGTPLLIINGIITDLEAVMALPVLDVDHIDVLKGSRAAIFGAQGGNGVIAIYTKRGERQNMIPTSGEYTFTMKGYHVPREFYSPDYSVKKDSHAKPDYRSTLYWDPDIKTNGKGKASVEFYTTDLPGNIQIEIQGLTNTGEKIVKRVEVEVVDKER